MKDVWLPDGYQEDDPEERLESKQRYLKYRLVDAPHRWVIIFYTSRPKPAELVEGTVAILVNRVVELTRSKTKFTIHELGEQVGDYS